MPPATDMTVPQAARALGCSAPTVRVLVADGLLAATATKRGKRTFLAINPADVDAYLTEHGGFSRRTRRQPESGGDYQVLLAEVRALREAVDARNSDAASVEVVALREALHLQRAAMAALQEADDARAQGVRHLREAMESFDDADIKRKRAITLLDEVVGSFTIPGNAQDLGD
ncbi:helix-turn-helix domain-containing protein [Nocardioides sp. LMS-CY]|uniref:helix-turn-helix domain-containing protein n=1 Tax=Nocardioides sp. (strain LMS-CY) TaxID=2840457 RepID=UPI001C0028F6|nr:helix-turn-helix domain-containing protein [Nocardioides sp. LMS-CY]QWF21770.1 helix-turn-helix domain-containing protein [Nocardioides sp. LMS-CY]